MNRRFFLSMAAAMLATPHGASAVPRPPPARQRLRLVNAHTGETFEGTYRDANGPIPRVIDELCVFLRDHHSGEKTEIDVGVIDFLAAVMDAAGQTSATILSAYRTPETNAMLARTNMGVAENSQHLYGRALDVHFGNKLPETMRAARAMQRGGVGWYPHSSFIHLDNGAVRNWDLDERGLGELLVGGQRVHINDKGELLVSGQRVNIKEKGELLVGGQRVSLNEKGELLVDGQRVNVKEKGELLVSGRSRLIIGGGKMPVIVRGAQGPATVRMRLARLHQLAKLEFLAKRPIRF